VEPGFVDSRDGLVVKKRVNSDTEDSTGDAENPDNTENPGDAKTPVTILYIAKGDKVEDEQLVRTYNLSVTAQADSNHEYNITVILEWAEEAQDESTPVAETK
jgi:hypothetical protein